MIYSMFNLSLFAKTTKLTELNYKENHKDTIKMPSQAELFCERYKDENADLLKEVAEN